LPGAASLGDWRPTETLPPWRGCRPRRAAPVAPARRPRSDDGFPRFSPDGPSIALASAGPGGERVMLMAADGSGVRTLTAGSEPAFRPAG
jgi:hypothetical protein